MGAFFTYNKENTDNVKPALDLFAEMGFVSPTTLEAGDWKICTYPQMTADKPDTVSQNGC